MDFGSKISASKCILVFCVCYKCTRKTLKGEKTKDWLKRERSDTYVTHAMEHRESKKNR